MRPTPDTPQRVLILQDDPVQAQLLERILVGGNYDTALADDPRELLASLQDWPTPDLLLIDVRLPQLDGLTALARLSEDARWCLVPVILLTSTSDPALVTASDRLPAPPEAVLTKPLDPMALLRWVRRILAADESVLRLQALRRRHLSVTLRLRALPSPLNERVSGMTPPPSTRAEADRDAVRSRLLLSLQALEDEMSRLRERLRRSEVPRL